MNRLKHLLMLGPLICLYNCSLVKKETLYYEDSIAHLNGMWVSTSAAESNNIVFDVNYSEGLLSMKLLGEPIIYQSMTKSKDQVLITFKDKEDQMFYLIGQLSTKNEMRLSFTKEEVKDIIPVGQLGEKVYRLERMQNSKATVIAARN